MSAEELKHEDFNGYWEKKDVLLSRVGIFPYLGAQIAGAPDPTRIYLVYRPEEELRAAVDTFTLVPWIDDHEMLGPEDKGCTPAEEKGVHGVTGEQVYFEEGGKSEDNPDGGIRGNIKLFSQSMKKKMEEGKEALSFGYRSRYDWTPGTWMGKPYDVVQRHYRGNHLALVGEGRMGPEVTVFDHLDIKEFVHMEDNEKKEGTAQDQEVTLEQLAEAIKALAERLGKLEAGSSDTADQAEDGEGKDDDAGNGENTPEGEGKDDAGATEDGEGKDDEGAAQDDSDKKEGTGMDAALRAFNRRLAKLEKNSGVKSMLKATASRDELVGRLTPLVGTFDHALMTSDEVAAYGCKKLGIKCGSGQEQAALSGYLAAAARRTPSTFTFDSATGPSKTGGALERYLKGDK